eukprot:TRINITY_DN22408_c0_g1_i1.p1 TRINITY_DN22408_c0_g1~~TRINITY_DN22408_c0_g1_i1.p1  ORF type:complete len:1241 (+),score=516.36 TRINITY_DN22408_c0_g1_i1:475-3723(+)
MAEEKATLRQAFGVGAEVVRGMEGIIDQFKALLQGFHSNDAGVVSAHGKVLDAQRAETERRRAENAATAAWCGARDADFSSAADALRDKLAAAEREAPVLQTRQTAAEAACRALLAELRNELEGLAACKRGVRGNELRRRSFEAALEEMAARRKALDQAGREMLARGDALLNASVGAESLLGQCTKFAVDGRAAVLQRERVSDVLEGLEEGLEEASGNLYCSLSVFATRVARSGAAAEAAALRATLEEMQASVAERYIELAGVLQEARDADLATHRKYEEMTEEELLRHERSWVANMKRLVAGVSDKVAAARQQRQEALLRQQQQQQERSPPSPTAAAADVRKASKATSRLSLALLQEEELAKERGASHVMDAWHNAWVPEELASYCLLRGEILKHREDAAAAEPCDKAEAAQQFLARAETAAKSRATSVRTDLSGSQYSRQFITQLPDDVCEKLPSLDDYIAARRDELQLLQDARSAAGLVGAATAALHAPETPDAPPVVSIMKQRHAPHKQPAAEAPDGDGDAATTAGDSMDSSAAVDALCEALDVDSVGLLEALEEMQELDRGSPSTAAGGKSPAASVHPTFPEGADAPRFEPAAGAASSVLRGTGTLDPLPVPDGRAGEGDGGDDGASLDAIVAADQAGHQEALRALMRGVGASEYPPRERPDFPARAHVAGHRKVPYHSVPDYLATVRHRHPARNVVLPIQPDGAKRPAAVAAGDPAFQDALDEATARLDAPPASPEFSPRDLAERRAKRRRLPSVVAAIERAQRLLEPVGEEEGKEEAAAVSEAAPEGREKPKEAIPPEPPTAEAMLAGVGEETAEARLQVLKEIDLEQLQREDCILPITATVNRKEWRHARSELEMRGRRADDTLNFKERIAAMNLVDMSSLSWVQLMRGKHDYVEAAGSPTLKALESDAGSKWQSEPAGSDRASSVGTRSVKSASMYSARFSVKSKTAARFQRAVEKIKHRPRLWHGEHLLPPEQLAESTITARNFRIVQPHPAIRDCATRKGIGLVIAEVNRAVASSQNHITMHLPVAYFNTEMLAALTTTYSVTANVMEWKGDHVELEIIIVDAPPKSADAT